MKKIKIFYKEHRIFTILMAIGLVCLIVIITVLFNCFYGGNGKDKYGTRLENKSDYEITEERLQDLESNFIMEEKVNKAEAKITGRIVYISIDFLDDVPLEDAKNIALKSLENFSEKEQDYYDFHFTLKESPSATSKGFLLSGAQNKNGERKEANGPKIVWNLNKEIIETEG